MQLFVLISTTGLSQSSGENAKLLEAFNAQNALELDKSRALFMAVVSDTMATKEEQCKALRQLAVQDWKFYKNYERAIQRLVQADSIGVYRSETWLKIHHIEEEAGHYTRALNAAKKATFLSEALSDKTLARYRYCRTIFKQAIHQHKTGIVDKQRLIEGRAILQEIVRINPTHTNAAELLLGISLLLADGDTAWNSWLWYFRFSSLEAVSDYLQPSATTLHAILTSWQNRSLTQTEKTVLIKGLAASRFYHFIKIIGQELENPDKEVADILRYVAYIEEVKVRTQEYYRMMAIQEGNSSDYFNFLTSRSRTLFEELKVSDKAENRFTFDNFRRFVTARFGTVLFVGQTSSSEVTSLIMGQTINKRIRTIEQYSHTADFEFTELDMMISNGYPSWFWEDRGAGGFAVPGGFVRVNTIYKYLGISAWELITDPVKRAKIERRIQQNVVASTLATDRNSILTGLTTKLELDALDNIYNRLVTSGYKGVDLQLKFIEHYDLYRDNATIFAHEGRHSLDKLLLKDTYYTLDSATIEYRARLSQIVFSEAPKLELANMVDATGTRGSAKANAMIVAVAEDWIKTNTDSIKNYDHNKQPIANLYLLTDTQIKSIYRNVDPFYIKE